MPIPAFDTIPDAVANTNFKTYGDASAAVALQMSQNSANHSNRVSVIGESLVAAWGNRLVKTDIVEAVSAQKMLTGRDSQGIAESIGLAQQLMKGAQTTPPNTSGG